MIILSPAYGRDYKSIKAVKEAFEADTDFIIENFDSRWCGKPANRSGIKEFEPNTKQVQIRYSNKQKVAVLKV